MAMAPASLPEMEMEMAPLQLPLPMMEKGGRPNTARMAISITAKQTSTVATCAVGAQQGCIV